MAHKKIEYRIDENGCHICTSHATKTYGYVEIRYDVTKRSPMHRFLYEQKFGEIPDGIVLRHKCDVRNCINLDHLETGSQQDNMTDMIERNRSGKGIKNVRAKLSDEEVLQIRADKISTNVHLGYKYKVSHSLISKIRKNYIWTHI